MRITHIVTPDEAGMTLQQILRGAMHLSGREARNAKARGGVTVDDAPFFSNQRVSAGMIVRVDLEEYAAASETGDVPVLLPEIVFEDDAFLAVHKPALLQCHPSPSAPRGSDTLEGRVSAYLGRPAHPVHRLDAETTGIVLFAKYPYVQAHLQDQMQRGSFVKAYQAWVCGVPAPRSGVVDAPIAREHPDSFTRIVTPAGQRAVSRYETLHTLALPGGACTSLLSLSPMTGRTHQLRVHMAHISCPLLGDMRYHTPESQQLSQALHLSYHQLAAVSLSFIHPVSGETVTLQHAPVFAFEPPDDSCSL